MKNKNPTDEEIILASKESNSMAEAYSKLGMYPSAFKRRALKLNVYKPNQGLKGVSKNNEIKSFPLVDILDGKHPQYNTYRLKNRLYEEGLKIPKCEICGITDWNGKEIALHLDHINGDSYDHRLENLRILCPNCHSQTDTYGSKRLKKAKPKKERKILKSKKIPKRKYGSSKDYHKAVRKQWEESQQKYKEMILDSDIDFSQFGWVKKVSELTGINRHKVNKWMKRIMPDFYEEKCFKRGDNK